VLQSLRLWPTTPAILRDTTEATNWETGALPEGSAVIIFAPLFHRDDRTLPYVDHFTPEIWLQDRSAEDWPLIPFSDGAGDMPGTHPRSAHYQHAARSPAAPARFGLEPDHALDPQLPLPATLSPYRLNFTLTREAMVSGL
jgi:hypothetical protein